VTDIFELFRRISSGTDSSQNTGAFEFIVCGLGNPGPEYSRTRHNAGFVAVDKIAAEKAFKIDRSKFSALTGECIIAGKRTLFMKPMTYMNESGFAVKAAADFYKIPPERIIVVQDDAALEPGRMRIRRKGSDGGQKGIRSIIGQLGSESFIRIKLGVGVPPDPANMINWVLGVMPPEDAEKFAERVNDVPGAVETLIGGDVDSAMQKYNN
jgi:PTH1 family peptidyl-tRNA hydrolase